MRIVAHERSSAHSTPATKSTQSNTPDALSEALRRARTDRVVRPVRRTLAEMAPGYVRQPVLRLVPQATTHEDGDDVCPMCMRWSCICGQSSTVSAPSARTALLAVA
ncbi:hypothetical protein ACFT8P_13985 [Streptomyces sp. NPDC057101]|uniref:hypothetical protein n=1 Tax=Streptomyces sp. NPDC057101 TaxID=3346020 RepID=UPI00363547EB